MSLSSITRLESWRLKVERAEKHFKELEAEIRAFLASNPYEVAAKHDANVSEVVYYVAAARDTPAVLPGICGDVLANLRGALDHLAYQLVSAGAGVGTKQKVYFPISD